MSNGKNKKNRKSHKGEEIASDTVNKYVTYNNVCPVIVQRDK